MDLEEAWERSGRGERVRLLEALVDVGDGRRMRLGDMQREDLARARAVFEARAQAADRRAAGVERLLRLMGAGS